MWTMKDYRLCPVLFSINGGWLLIMPKCKVLTDGEFEGFDYDTIMDTHIKDGVGHCYLKSSAETKSDSFGWYKGNIVAIDYGD